MKYHDPYKKNGTITTQVMCAVVFSAFSLAWLYFFQADVLAVGQHILSKGQTSYDRTLGAVLITGALMALQQIVAFVTRLRRRTHALTYLPSMLLLAIISHVGPDVGQHACSSIWCWAIPAILVLWLLVVWLARKISPSDKDNEPTGLFSRRVWLNMLQMVCMMLAVAAISNTNAVFHYRAHAETALLQGNIDEALRVGEESHETNCHLTMLRAYALSLKGQLGERLFEYPIAGSGSDLLPLRGSKSRTLLISPDSIFRHLGARPVGINQTAHYLELLEKDSLATPAAADYKLCGMLIDRDIDRFARTLSYYYKVNDSLPRHYREALTLYAHRRSHPVTVYSNAVMDEDWANLQQLEAQFPLYSERKARVASQYKGSYWYYYFYEK